MPAARRCGGGGGAQLPLARNRVGASSRAVGSRALPTKKARVVTPPKPDPLDPPAVKRADNAGPVVTSDVAAVILGGAESDSRRLFPLTEKRTLPAIPIGGNYRLIDVAMSNCINSNIFKIYILTQYNSTSLNKYLSRTYNLGGGVPVGGSGFMEVVAATQSPTSQRWADGAADSVRQWLALLGTATRARAINYVMVLPSDQVYRTDFSRIVGFHRDNMADITIVCREVQEARADHFGLVRLNKDSTILEFQEKPTGENMTSMSMDWEDISDFLKDGILDFQALDSQHGGPGDERAYIASCGMYIFSREVLEELLAVPKSRDFGRDVIPNAIKSGKKVMAYHMDSFWDDIGGSVEDFYNFNMAIAREEIDFSFSEPGQAPFYTCPTNLPPSMLDGVDLHSTIVGPGTFISGGKIIESIIGTRSIIGSGCNIAHSVVMGADYYEEEKKWPRAVSATYPPIGIGKNCIIDKCIIDKNVRIGNNCQLVNKEGVHESMDRIKEGICVRDGILLVSKSAVVPDGTII